MALPESKRVGKKIRQTLGGPFKELQYLADAVAAQDIIIRKYVLNQTITDEELTWASEKLEELRTVRATVESIRNE